MGFASLRKVTVRHDTFPQEGHEKIRRLEASHDHVIGYSLSGDVTEDEYTQAASELRDEIARHGKIRLLFRLKDLTLSTFFAALDDRFRFVNEHQDDIERVAVVSDDAASGVLAKAAGACRVSGSPASPTTMSPRPGRDSSDRCRWPGWRHCRVRPAQGTPRVPP